MSDRIYYVICGDGCKFESMTKEQILTAIQQAVSTGEIKDVNAGIITTIREKNKNAGLSFWYGTTAEYNAIPKKDDNCYYIITDSTEKDDIYAAIESCKKETEAVSEKYTEVSEKYTEVSENVNAISDRHKAEDEKKNKTLWSGSVGFSSWISGGERVNNIKDYSLVIVKITINEIKYAVLCTVNEITPDTLFITGVSVLASGIESNEYIWQANIYIKLFDGCFTAQQSYRVTLNETATTLAPISVNEIIGVM